MNINAIWIYPIKSLSGVKLTESNFNKSGGLFNDRRFRFKTKDGQVVNGKRFPKIQIIRAEFDSEITQIRLADSAQLSLQESNEVNKKMSELMELDCFLEENSVIGFPDDVESPGPTVVSRQSLEYVANHFELDYEECLRRFRPNMVVDLSFPFQEDEWVGRVLETEGGIALKIINHCRRCSVPTRDSRTGVSDREFMKEFISMRQTQLTPLIQPDFENAYRFTLNTVRIDKTENHISVGESFRVIG